MNISKEKFTELAKEHLTALESYTTNKIELYGIEKLYEAINYTSCCKSDSELLLCGICDKETEHEQISSTELKCLECGNISVE